MKTYLLNIWDDVRTSYWFVPSVFSVGSILLSYFMPLLDAIVWELGIQLPDWILTTTDSAQTTLSSMAAAVVTVTGTVFSITIVTLSLTSQQFGPRLLRRFMYDLPTQITLGVFISTGLYCLLLLRVVDKHQGGVEAPHLSVFLGVVLTALSLAMLIVFIQRVTKLIQAPQVVAAVAHDLDNAIVRLFPEAIGAPPSEDDLQAASAVDQEAELDESFVVVRSAHVGYIQAIDNDGVLEISGDRDLVVRLRSRPGDFIAKGTPLAEVWHTGQPPSEKEEIDALDEAVNEAIIVGERRTPRQDVECAINELVEIAVRSLSPGINDPFTAMSCIDRLGAALGQLAERQLPTKFRCDDDGRLRIIARPFSFAGILEASFNQIRQYGRDSVAVIIRLLEALESVVEHIQRKEDRELVKRHAEIVAQLGNSIPEEHDRQEIRERFELVLKQLSQGVNSA